METALTATLRSPVEAEAIAAESFEQLVRLHQRRVYRLIYLLLKDADAADTLTQECFLRAYQKRSSFRGECKIETWLLRIAVNLARDHGKNRRAGFWRRLLGVPEQEAQTANLAGPEPSPERVVLAREELSAVWAATASLSGQQRSIFLLRFAEEMPLAEIAGVLGVQVGTVKAQLSRATAKVRQAVKEKS
ncbi:MAG TPA: sigma-70 family RNA polymerase sigma factor [Terriglobales bacterium]|nr:sigma-70 family RNA polymerase sigma factor [Terriglobales bacterium]